MLLWLTLLTPLAFVTVIAGAGLLPPDRRAPFRRGVAVATPVAVVPAVALALAGEGTTSTIPWMLFGTTLAVDAIARPLLLVAALLYGAALMATSWLEVADTERGCGALSAFLLTSFVGNIGTYLAADAVTFYLSFTVMSFSAVGLVIHYRTPAAHRATKIYLVMSVLSETALLAGLLLVVHAGGLVLADAPRALAQSDHAGLVVGLLLFALGIKAGTVPLHVWLPLAHPAAPPAASAVLSGAMVKAGFVGWLRFLTVGESGTGPGVESVPAPMVTAGWVLLSLSLLGTFLVVVFGVLQNDPKVVLAYSTISQMGFVGAVVAVGMLVPDLAQRTAAAAVVYAVHHGLAKGALFLGVPVVKHYGRGVVGVVVLVGMALTGLSLAGAPLTSGAFGKYVSKDAVAGILVLGVGLDTILPLVATGTTVLLMRFAWVMWHSEREPRRRADGELVSWLAVVAAGVTVPWWVGERWTPLDPPAWSASVVWDATWPMLLGLGIGGLAWALAARGVLPGWMARADGTVVEPGDLVVAEESLVLRTWDRGGRGLHRVHGWTRWVAHSWSGLSAGLAERGRRIVYAAEARLGVWEASGLAILLLLAGTVVLALGYGRWWA